MDLGRIVGNSNVGFHDLFVVDSGSVCQGSYQGKLDDAVVGGRDSVVSKSKARTFSFEKVLCHEQEAQDAPFEHHSQTP